MNTNWINRPLTAREQATMSTVRRVLFSLTIVVAMLCGCRARAADWTTNKTVTFRWTYPTNEVTEDLQFTFWTTTNLYATNMYGTNALKPWKSWDALTNIPGTNLSWKLSIKPGVHFFLLTATNFWGSSDPSNVVGTPEPPHDGSGFTISRDRDQN